MVKASAQQSHGKQDWNSHEKCNFMLHRKVNELVKQVRLNMESGGFHLARKVPAMSHKTCVMAHSLLLCHYCLQNIAITAVLFCVTGGLRADEYRKAKPSPARAKLGLTGLILATSEP